MVLHKVSACIETERETVLYSTVSPCELWRNSQCKLTAIWRLGCGRKPNGQREGEVRERLSLARMQPFAWEKQQFS